MSNELVPFRKANRVFFSSNIYVWESCLLTQQGAHRRSTMSRRLAVNPYRAAGIHFFFSLIMILRTSADEHIRRRSALERTGCTLYIFGIDFSIARRHGVSGLVGLISISTASVEFFWGVYCRFSRSLGCFSFLSYSISFSAVRRVYSATEQRWLRGGPLSF